MTEEQANSSAPKRRRRRRRRTPATKAPGSAETSANQSEEGAAENSAQAKATSPDGASNRPRRRRRRGPATDADVASHAHDGQGGQKRPPREPREPRERLELSGVIEFGGSGKGNGKGPRGPKSKFGGGGSPAFLRQLSADLKPLPTDPEIPSTLVRKHNLKEGNLVTAIGFQSGRHAAPRVDSIETIDGVVASESSQRKSFKKLTVIDPDFHYELGLHEQEGKLSMRVIDLLSPIGRGQRGLLVAPPKTGKTTLLMNVATAMQALYPDVHLMVLLVDERPEEATYWRRAIEHGEVYVSTMDQTPKNHVRLAEMVQARAERLVEAGQEVVILLDSITRLTRAYNNVLGGKESRTMSGGLDARVFQKPKHFFGAARNTEDGGSLTIFASALIDTGSRMDQVIYEEFKGTGNMELTLDRRLADRRIYPAVSIESSATRKEERLLTRTTLRKVNILRRVLSRLRPREAMEMLIDRLDRYPSNQEFLNAFSTDDV